MKQVIVIISIALAFFSCTPNNNSDSKQKNKSESQELIEKSREEIEKIDRETLSAREFGELILKNEIEASDDDLSVECMRGIFSKDLADRDFYFDVFMVIANEADGAVSEITGQYIKELLETETEFFITRYTKMKEEEQHMFLTFLADELYLSGLEFEDDLEEYFDEIKTYIKEATDEQISSLKEILNKIKTLVKE